MAIVKKYPERYKYTDPENDVDMFGGGFGYPVTVNKTGEVTCETGVKHIGSCIKHFAMYNYTDLPGTPRFGGGIIDIPWRLITSNYLGKKEEQMRQGLEFWEPRIEEVQVSAGRVASSPNEVVVKTLFKIRATGEAEYYRFSRSHTKDEGS